MPHRAERTASASSMRRHTRDDQVALLAQGCLIGSLPRKMRRKVAHDNARRRASVRRQASRRDRLAKPIGRQVVLRGPAR